MYRKIVPITAMALMWAGFTAPAQAQSDDQPAPAAATATDPTKDFIKKVNDATGLEFFGYMRSGFHGARKGQQKGGYSLGGDLQFYRLGNEGNHYVEFGIAKTFDVGNGVNWRVLYQPNVFNGNSGTAQAYTSLSGIFGNSISLWGGQRHHRIQDIHIVDHFFMEDGNNFGAGIDDIPLGGLGSLNVALHTAGTFDNHDANPNNAKRLNFQWRKIPVNPNGTLSVTGGLISGDFAQGKDGWAAGVLHKQKDFLVPGLNNSLALQVSSGHASINGSFYNLDNSRSETGILFGPETGVGAAAFSPLVTRTIVTPRPGAKQRRILDTIDFQIGKWGGQALVGYQTLRPDDGPEIKDFSVGGRVTYGLAKYTKLVAELGTTRRSVEDQEKQRLSKATLALAFSPANTFWSRPEFRIYATRVNWNKPAALANLSSFGANNRTNATTFGVQMEAWWE